MVNYRNGKLYVLRRSDNDNIFYIGSTCATLKRRQNEHKQDSKRYTHPVCKYIKKLRKSKINFYIELFKLYPCDSKQELCKKEGKTMLKLRKQGHNLCNITIAGRTKQEYQKTNKYKKIQQRGNFWKVQEIYKQKIIQCNCGAIIKRGCLSAQRKSKKHQNWLQEEVYCECSMEIKNCDMEEHILQKNSRSNGYIWFE